MKWFDNWLLKRLRIAAAEVITVSDDKLMHPWSYPSNKLSQAIAKDNQLQCVEKSIRFTIYNANGGRIIETRKSDFRLDRDITGLYIITSDQNFGHEIDKIITLESLKNS
jgi:hypothetical protein